MLLLSAVMAFEKTSQWSRVIVPIVGVCLLLWGGLTLPPECACSRRRKRRLKGFRRVVGARDAHLQVANEAVG